MESIENGILSVKNGKCRVKGLVLGSKHCLQNLVEKPPGHYDLWSQSIRERNVLVLIFAVADVVT